MKYVLGFMFDKFNRVAMVRKTRGPVNLHGLWNGIGGKISYQEDPYEAMVREFAEETNIFTHAMEWGYQGIFRGPAFMVLVYKAEFTGELAKKLPAVNDVGEELMSRNLEYLHETHYHDCPDNIRWLIPMVMSNSIENFEIMEK